MDGWEARKERVREEAKKCAQADYDKNLTCNSGRYGARPDSIWDDMYKDEYQKILLKAANTP